MKSYPTGFYADLAKGQIDKIAAEDARLAATEKARETTEEKARLAAEGAKQGDLAKAAAAAKTAENARIAAEKTKRIEQAKVDAAERARERLNAPPTPRLPSRPWLLSSTQERSSGANAPASTTAPSSAPVVAQTPAQQTASLTPPSEPVVKPALSAVDITKSVQTELRRVGCYGGSADGEWDKASRLSLEKFNRYAGAELNVKLASLDTLDVIKGKSARVCPLICRHGYKADGDACVKIACGEGKVLNDDNECVARKERKTPARRRANARTAGRAAPAATGLMTN